MFDYEFDALRDSVDQGKRKKRNREVLSWAVREQWISRAGETHTIIKQFKTHT